MKVIAAKGMKVTLYIASGMVEIDGYKPFDLSGYTKEQRAASNLKALFDNGWLEKYTTQEVDLNHKDPSISKNIPVLMTATSDSGEIKISADYVANRMRGPLTDKDVARLAQSVDVSGKSVEAEVIEAGSTPIKDTSSLADVPTFVVGAAPKSAKAPKNVTAGVVGNFADIEEESKKIASSVGDAGIAGDGSSSSQDAGE